MPTPDVFRHYKGPLYRLLADHVRDANNGPLNLGGTQVIYQELTASIEGLPPQTWRRSREEFFGATLDGDGRPVRRFEAVDLPPGPLVTGGPCPKPGEKSEAAYLREDLRDLKAELRQAKADLGRLDVIETQMENVWLEIAALRPEAADPVCAEEPAKPIVNHPWRKHVPAGTFVLSDVSNAPCDDCGNPWRQHATGHVSTEAAPPAGEEAACCDAADRIAKAKRDCRLLYPRCMKGQFWTGEFAREKKQLQAELDKTTAALNAEQAAHAETKKQAGCAAHLRIYLPRRVGSDLPTILGKGIVAEPGEYPAWINAYGAVCAILPDGEMLGVKPGEFEWIGAIGEWITTARGRGPIPPDMDAALAEARAKAIEEAEKIIYSHGGSAALLTAIRALAQKGGEGA